MLTVTVLVHEAEEGGYWAEVPELPGRVSQGDSLDELERNIVEAIQAVIQVRREGGESFPPVRRWELSVPV